MILFMSLSVVFCALCVAVPGMAAELVGGVAGLGLAHMFEAAYTARTIARIITPLSQGLKKVSDRVSALALTGQPRQQQFVMHDRFRSPQRQSDPSAVTRPLNPSDAAGAVQPPKVRPPRTGKNATAAMAPCHSTTEI
jgi:hypothetical protein